MIKNLQISNFDKLGHKILFLLLFALGFILIDFIFNLTYINFVYLFILEIILLINKFKSRSIITIILLFSSLWSVEFIITDSLGWALSSGIVTNQLKLFFQLLIVGFLPLFFVPIKENIKSNESYNGSLWNFKLIFFVSLFITVFKINGVVVLGGVNGGFEGYTDNLEKGSGIIEYVLILFCFLFLFKNVSRVFKVLRTILILVYIIKCNLYGFRIQGIMASVLLYNVFIASRVSTFKSVLIFFPGVILAMLLGLAKHTDKLELALLLNNDAIESTHMGTTISGTIALKSYPTSYTASVFSIVTWIIPPSVLAEKFPELYPSKYAQDKLGAAGGMPFPITGYLFASIIGVLVFSSIFCYFFYIIINSNKSSLFHFLSLVIIVFFPRWILYDFVNFGIRTVIYSFLFFVIMNTIDKYFLKSTILKRN